MLHCATLHCATHLLHCACYIESIGCLVQLCICTGAQWTVTAHGRNLPLFHPQPSSAKSLPEKASSEKWYKLKKLRLIWTIIILKVSTSANTNCAFNHHLQHNHLQNLLQNQVLAIFFFTLFRFQSAITCYSSIVHSTEAKNLDLLTCESFDGVLSNNDMEATN